MSNFITGKVLRELSFGIKVERATATLPASTTGNIFTISGGRVAITQLVGEVTTVIQTQACNLKLTGNPTTGTSADICANLNISAKEVGALFGISGLNTDALQCLNAGASMGQTRVVILNTGTLDLETSATNTGSVKWTLFYIPIDDGAYVEAA